LLLEKIDCLIDTIPVYIVIEAYIHVFIQEFRQLVRGNRKHVSEPFEAQVLVAENLVHIHEIIDAVFQNFNIQAFYQGPLVQIFSDLTRKDADQLRFKVTDKKYKHERQDHQGTDKSGEYYIPGGDRIK